MDATTELVAALTHAVALIEAQVSPTVPGLAAALEQYRAALAAARGEQ